MVKRIIFCLGSNVGDRQFYIDEAIKSLESRLELKNLKKSSIFQNPAKLLEGSPKEWDMDFFNIALSADIDLEKFPPLKILKLIQQIEIDVGKNYRGKWAPREIDIDIALIDGLKMNLENVLQIPHQHLLEREFFLKTIEEIEPDILLAASNLKSSQ
ncbi:MAG: 2-amino-4-hydroxy-6-hydroxymethyldihydropteridine-pyrophosphokinae [Rickettsiaceae bacterium]|nr:2-amino-4-hydroxy-6-hydroxymethyldihydropteridine-pyrophosphokinae [Rickettsiaceae bacterium]